MKKKEKATATDWTKWGWCGRCQVDWPKPCLSTAESWRNGHPLERPHHERKRFDSADYPSMKQGSVKP